MADRSAIPPPAELHRPPPSPTAHVIVGGPPGRRPAPASDRDPVDLGWRWLGIGFAAALVSGFVLPANFTWFLAAIPHEMGHATIGCLLGHPSAPAISLRGEAWTGVGEQRPFLVWLIVLAAMGAAWALRHAKAAAVSLGALALLVPCLAFTSAGEAAITVAGHGAELAFAAYCFYLAVTGGRTGTPQERIASAMAGALLQCSNLKLCFGLVFRAEARAEYASNGSLGLTNDYLRLADEVFGCSLQAVAAMMLVVALLPLPVGVFLGRRKLTAE